MARNVLFGRQRTIAMAEAIHRRQHCYSFVAVCHETIQSTGRKQRAASV